MSMQAEIFRTRLPALTQILTQVCAKACGFIEIYLTKWHEFLCFQEYFERFSGGCKLQPPLWFWTQIAFRMVFPIASAALCFIPGVEWT